MIYLTATLFPGGNEMMARTLGTGRIANMSNLATKSDYDASFAALPALSTPVVGLPPGFMLPYGQRAKVTGYDRETEQVWELVYQALANARRNK